MRGVFLGVVLTLLLLPGAALAKNRTYAPPGNSGVNQYVENVPTGGGNRPASSVHPGTGVPGGGGGGSGPISGSTQRSFDHNGAAGRAAVALAEATAPGSVPKQRRTSGGSSAGGTSPGSAASAQGFSPLRSLFKTFTGSASGGLGALLPIILVVTALGAMMLAVLRRRRAT
jgi:hypothetical protein